MGKLTRTYLQATRLVLAKTAAYTVTAGAAFRAGTSASKLSTATADTIIAQIYATTSAVTGTLWGLYIDLTASAAGAVALEPIYLQMNMNVNMGAGEGTMSGTGIEVYISCGASFATTAWVWGARFQVDVNAAVTTGSYAGVYVEINTAAASLTSYGVCVANNRDQNASAAYYAAGKFNYLLELVGTGDAWATTGTLSVAAGTIKIHVGGAVRYIPLYSS